MVNRVNRLSLILLMMLALFTFTFLSSNATHINAQTEAPTESPIETTPSLPEIYQKINPSVVNIDVTIPASAASSDLLPTVPSGPGGTPDATPQDQQPEFAEGSGFVYDAQGDIVTNAHVVQDATKIVVTFPDDTALIAKIVGIDPDSDLAVIHIDPTGLTLMPLTLGDSDKLQVGERAIAIGNPFGETGSMTQGIISGVGRTVEGLHSSGTSNYLIPDIIQTDASINPGNSGGVLLNTQGEVIGVTTSIASPIRQSSGVGFAVPSNLVKKVAAALVKDGKIDHAYLGIAGQTLNLDYDQLMNLPANFHGVLVEEVTSGSPAAKAGVLPSTVPKTLEGSPTKIGGDIIVAIDNVKVKQFEDLLSYLYVKTDPGQKVTLTVYRDGKTVDLDVTLTVRPTQ